MSTGRSLRWSVALSALFVIAVACGDDADTSGTTSTSASSTTTTSTSTTTTSSTLAPIPTDELTLLVAHDNGIDLVGPSGTIAVLDGRSIAMALPDRLGGILFQEEETALGPVPIEHLSADDLGSRAEPSVLFDEPEARRIWLDDVTSTGGAPAMLYRVWRTLPNDCPPDDEECRWDHEVEHLEILDLVDGTTTNLGTISSFESSYVRHSLGEQWMATSFTPYSAPFTCVTIHESSILLQDPTPDRWIGAGTDDSWLPYNSCFSDDAISRPMMADTAPDGSSVAIVSATRMFDRDLPGEPLTLRIVDPASRAELARSVIGGDDDGPSWIDFDGVHAVIGRSRQDEPVPSVLVASDGTVTELDLDGRIAIWVDGS